MSWRFGFKVVAIGSAHVFKPSEKDPELQQGTIKYYSPLQQSYLHVLPSP